MKKIVPQARQRVFNEGLSKLDLAWVSWRKKCSKSYQWFLFWVSTTRLLCESLFLFWGNSVARHQMNPNERESRLSFICYVMFKRIKLLKRCELNSLCSLVASYHVAAHKGFCFLFLTCKVKQPRDVGKGKIIVPTSASKGF